MLSLNDEFVTAIQAEKLRIAEIYDVTIPNGDTYYYTSHTSKVTWQNEYLPIPIKRTEIGYRMNLEADDVTITVGGISGDLYALLQANAADGASVQIKRILWDRSYAADMEEIIFLGTANFEFDRREITLHCKSILDSLNLQVPREIYQEPCNNRFCDSFCGLTLADYLYEGVATNDGTDQFTLIDTLFNTVYKVAFTDGDINDPPVVGTPITGDIGGGEAIVLYVLFYTDTTGVLYYVQQTGTQFVSGEVISNV